MSDSTWIVQRKLFKSDWETVASETVPTKAQALKPFEHMNGKLRAVSPLQAERDYQAGRADNFRRVLREHSNG